MRLRAIAFTAWALLSVCTNPAFAHGPNEWSRPGMTKSRPHLMFSVRDGVPAPISMTCNLPGSMKFYVSGFVPAQKWPQPVMAISFGDVERKQRPDLHLNESQVEGTKWTSFTAEFQITDSVLDAIAKGAPIKIRFDGQEQSFPAPPQALRQEFATKCTALLPAVLRKG